QVKALLTNVIGSTAFLLIGIISLIVGSVILMAVSAFRMRAQHRAQVELERFKKEAFEANRRLDELRSREGLSGTSDSPAVPQTDPGTVPPAMYLEEIELTNIRCFEHVTISLNGATRALMLGDNASGKSTVLRAIALSVCNESDATTLMTTWPGAVLREGEL